MTSAAEYTLAGRRIWVAGHNGMVGSALVRRLQGEGCAILTVDRTAVDLRRQEAVEAWMQAEKPDTVILAAAKVGGILANNTYPADFLYDNLAIEGNIIATAQRIGVRKLLFLGSSCIYPRLAPQPIREDYLLTGPLEETNEWYAVAKIAGIKLCQAYRRQHGADFISAMPTNLYGPGDSFNLQNSHVLPALMLKMHEAKLANAPSVEIWGSGQPRREFMHVDDLADALVHLLVHYSGETHVNVGVGEDLTIRDLAELIARVVGYKGTFVHNTSRPDGTPRKLLDVSKLMGLGWSPRISLEAGIRQTYEWMLANAIRR